MPTKNRKRILIFNWRDMRHEQAGGAEMYIQQMARRWHSQGHAVTMFCGNDGKSPREEVVDGVRIIRRGSFNAAYLWAFMYYIYKFRGSFDVIVDCHNGIPFFTPMYTRTPVICVVHHVHQEVFKQFLSRPAALLASFLEKTAMPFVYGSRRYITVSESSKQAMVEELNISSGQIRIVHNGVDLDAFTPGAKSAVPMALYVGRLKAYKSVDVLIRAFEKVAQLQPSAQLVIAGTGDHMLDLKRLTSELGLTNNVQFKGFVTDEQKINLMQQAWVFCNPSFTEGWGITTIEANACGTPVVASDVAGLRDSVDAATSGYLVPYGDVAGFADKILTVFMDNGLRKQLSINARLWSENFSWQVSADKFMRLISSTLRRERSHNMSFIKKSHSLKYANR